jgi:hypothetical protein
MKVKVTRNIGGHKDGDTIEVTEVVGAKMIERGDATEVKARGAKAKDDDA